jgi:hypothetical protein
MQIIKKQKGTQILLKLVGYYLEWIRNRWVITVLICILVITAAILIVVLLCQPHEGAYTNAWYVKYDNEFTNAGREMTRQFTQCAFTNFGCCVYVYGA